MVNGKWQSASKTDGRSSHTIRILRPIPLSLPFTIFHLPFPVDFRPTDEQELLRRTVREFAEAEMRPHVMEWDEAQHFPMDLLPKLAALGLMGIQFSEEFGGSAMSAVNY